MFEEIRSLDAFNRLTEQEAAILCYFSTEKCTVCKALKPKVSQLIQEEYPHIKLVYISSDLYPEIAGQYRVFAAPTLLLFFDGREFIRKSRAFGIDELRREIDRPYHLIFNDDADPLHTASSSSGSLA